MSNKKTWVQLLGAVALAIGVSSAMLGGTLAAFAASEQTQREVRALHPHLAGLAEEQRERAA